MSSVIQQPPSAFHEIASSIRSHSRWFIALGVLQVLAGTAALTFSFSATIASVALLGFILLVAAGAQVAAAIMARSWKGFVLFLLIGILYGVSGMMTLTHPVAAAEGLTLMLAAALICGGTFRIAVAIVERFPSWGWVLVNGLMTLMLGLIIAAEWPVSGLWVIGAFVGIDLVVNGVYWIVVSVEVRRMLAPPIAH